MNSRCIHRRQEHCRAGGAAVIAVVARHDDAEAGADRAGYQPFAAVDDKILAVPARGCQQHRRICPGAWRWLGHHEARADLARGKRSQPPLLLVFPGDGLEEVHIAFVGCEAIERDRPQRRVPGGFEHDRLAAMIETEPAPFAAGMWAEKPRLTPQRNKLAPQRLAQPVRSLPGVALIGQHFLAHEALGAFLQLEELVGERKVHWPAPLLDRDGRAAIVGFSGSARQGCVSYLLFLCSIIDNYLLLRNNASLAKR